MMDWLQTMLFTVEAGNPAQLPLWPCGHAQIIGNDGTTCRVCTAPIEPEKE